MDSTAALWSVIIPTCNRPALLAACLRQLAPGRPGVSDIHFEVIVSDDSTGQATHELVGRDFPWVRWIEGPRRGAAANRNRAAASACGAWLLFTDDDCLPTATWLAEYAAAAKVSPNVAVWEGRTLSDRPLAGPFEHAPINEGGGLLWSCNFAIRAEAFRALGGFDEQYGSYLEDVDFRTRVERARLPMQFLPAALVIHPPRPVRRVVRQALDHRSYFLFARKYGVSVREAGFSAHAYARWRWMMWRSCRSMGESLRFALRCMIEAALLGPLCFWWMLQIRKTSSAK